MDLNFAKSLSSGLALVRPLEPLSPGGIGSQAAGSGNEFQTLLSGAIDNIKSTQTVADNQISSFLNGEQVDIHQVATSVQKAGLTFELAIEVRNKMMQAYQEVMRMQI